MKIIIAILLLSSFMSCVPQVEQSTTRSGGSAPFVPGPTTPFRWSQSLLTNGLNIKLADEFRNDFSGSDYDSNGRDLIEQMMMKWNAADSSRTYFAIPAASVANKDYSSLSQYQDGELGIYKSHSWFSDVSSSALAVTQFYAIRRNAGASTEYLELTHADIIVNYRDHQFSTDAFSSLDYDLPSVLIHELGHFIGMQHNSNYYESSVMQPYMGTRDVFRALYSADQANLLNLYNGATSLTTSDSGFRAAAKVAAPNEGEEVSGYFELRTDGICKHYINHEFIGEHSVVPMN
ncbi:MAG: hypothetical protein COW00_03375 [Bdellovibrio sp. CG12_big_fil_rev_8_21_14_0_65_39_13]|nr:MAG: hypothetical protein COW00_03375 [Bdellovibrio sp. CG12_big_fil_rev_8_21_14_0_65_39_13]